MADNADQSADKTEEPSERQLQKNRQSGQVARSRDLMTAINGLLLFVFVGVEASGAMADALLSLFHDYEYLVAQAATERQWFSDVLQNRFHFFPSVFVPMMLVTLVSSVLGAASSGPLIFSGKVVGFKLQRINPVQGIGKLFSSKGAVEVVKALMKTVILGAGLYGFLQFYFSTLVGRPITSLPAMVKHGGNILLWAGIGFSLMLLVMAIPDVFWQRYRTRKDQMQTRQQAKESQKNEEGSPESRQRLRRVQRQQAAAVQKKMLDAVPDADVIVTNPEHYAVALRYQPEQDAAPVVIAKGVDFIAALITDKARQASKPVLVQPMLTRALYYHTEVGQPVAPDLYNAVARIMVYLYQLDQYRQHSLPERPRSPVIKVPEKYDYLKTR